MPPSSLPALRTRLEQRRGEIEQAILTRIFAVAQPTASEDAQYLEGLKAAASAALDYGLDSIERGTERAGPPPPALLAQARLAARNGIGLETVLRRYFAGYTLLGDFLIAEAERSPRLEKSALQPTLRAQAALFDRLVAAVSEEYEREAKDRPSTSAEQRRLELVQKLLAGELLDLSELVYELDAFHVGLAATGPAAAETVRSIAADVDCRLLLVRRREGTVWAWLGGRRPLSVPDLKRSVPKDLPSQLRLALGEPAQGASGWRLSHRQAKAALPIASRGGEQIVRYADVAMLASMLRDDVLINTLHKLYLAPLEGSRDKGEISRQTLRAYFESDRRVTSTAAAMNLTRQTVRRRLRGIEELLGQPLEQCVTELELTLRLERIADLPQHADGNVNQQPGDRRG